MKRQIVKDAFIWGIVLWLFGYVLGIALFAFVPHSLIGWIIMPFGIILTLWVLLKKINADSYGQYFIIAIVWTLIAVVLDYFLLVKLFKPADGYYKLDVYLYYILTFALPVLVGVKKFKLEK